MDDFEKNSISPWKPLNDLKVILKTNKKNIFKFNILFKLKGSKSKSQTSSDSKLTAYDKQLLEDMRGATPNPRLTTIDEEKSKLRNRFMKSNKLMPFDDRIDSDSKPIKSFDRERSWAIAGDCFF